MTDRIYHNPRCRKSRETLALLRENGLEPEIVEYLKDPPSPEELADLCRLLGINPAAIIRSKEPLFRELGLSLKDDRSDAEWIGLLAKHPKLIERPIVVRGKKAVIGRPPTNVVSLL